MEPEAITAARELSPVITKLRQATETDRRIAAPIVEQLRDLRLCRMALVRDLEGLELPTPEALGVYEVLAAAEASVAWIVWNNALPCLFSRFLEPAARAEIFADPSWLYASSTRASGCAAAADGGYRIDGRWALVSGCELAEWIAVMCIVVENGVPKISAEGAPEARLAFLRRGEYAILDTWHVGGLRGTGSHDVVVKDRSVPRERTLSPRDPSTLGGPLGRIPMVCTMAAGYASQTLGMAQKAVATLVDLAGTKPSFDPGPALRDRQAFQASLARHGAALEAARAYLRSHAGRLWDAASSDAPIPMEDIGALWGAALHAVEVSRDAVDTMYAAGGTSSLYSDCPLERAHRDLHAMLRHVVAQPHWLEDAGRVTLGMAPAHPLYAV
jgi:indole-3-acetate monooxygenase